MLAEAISDGEYDPEHFRACILLRTTLPYMVKWFLEEVLLIMLPVDVTDPKALLTLGINRVFYILWPFLCVLFLVLFFICFWSPISNNPSIFTQTDQKEGKFWKSVLGYCLVSVHMISWHLANVRSREVWNLALMMLRSITIFESWRYLNQLLKSPLSAKDWTR